MSLDINPAKGFAVRQLPAVEAVLNYLAAAAERPRTYTYDPPPGEPRTTVVSEPHALPIHDVRPIASSVAPVSRRIAPSPIPPLRRTRCRAKASR